MRPEAISRVTIDIVAHPDPFVVRLGGVIDTTNHNEVAALASHLANSSGSVIVDLRDMEVLGSAKVFTHCW